MARDCAISRRSFVATSGVLAGLAAAGAASAPTFSKADDAAAAYEEGVTEVWGHCAINCPGRCALKFHVKDGEVLWVDTYSNPTNDLDDPQPRACLRGRSYRRWMNNPDRINYPMKRVEGTKRGDGQYEQISWDEALQTIAEKLKYTIDTYGNEAVYINYATGVSCTTARPLGRLMNLLGGSLSYYGSYSLAQQQWIVPYMFAGMPGSSLSAMADSDLVLCFGSSPSETRQGGAVSHHDWVRGREYTKGKVYIIDPRLNDSAMGHSEQWLPINPGTDAALCSAIAHELIVNDQVDHEFLDTYCVGFDESTMPESAKGQNKSYTDYIMGTGYDMVEKTPEWAAPLCGISADRIRSLTEEIAAAEHMFVFQGWGPQRRSNGEMNGMSICMLPLLTGNIGLPGTSTGLREGSRSFSLKSMPAGDNPVKTKISVFSMVDAIDHGTEMTEVADGVKGKEKLDTNIKFVFNYAGNCITNQNSDINHVHDVMSDDTKCEFVVGSDIVMCDSMKYCDIILPDMFRFEQDSMIATGGDDAYMICGQPCLPEVKFERKTNYEWVSELAELMGVGEEFTEGKTEREWIDSLYEAAREEKPELPPLEVFRDLGVVTQKSEAPLIALEAFRADPVANPLKTPPRQDRDLLRGSRPVHPDPRVRRRRLRRPRACVRHRVVWRRDHDRRVPARVLRLPLSRPPALQLGLRRAAQGRQPPGGLDQPGRRRGARHRPGRHHPREEPVRRDRAAGQGHRPHHSWRGLHLAGCLARRRHERRPRGQGRLHQHPHHAAPQPPCQGQPPAHQHLPGHQGLAATSNRRGESKHGTVRILL